MLYAIIGGGSVVAILALGGLCYWCYRRGKGGTPILDFKEFSFPAFLHDDPTSKDEPSKDEQLVRESKYDTSSDI